jgi:hypothetical protein
MPEEFVLSLDAKIAVPDGTGINKRFGRKRMMDY